MAISNDPTTWKDLVAGAGFVHIFVHPIKNGKWRAYAVSERTPGNRNSNFATDAEVIRDGYDNIISGTNREELIAKIKTEYPGWKWY